MRAFTIIVRTLLIIGGLGILIFYPIMIKNIANDALFQPLSVVTNISIVAALTGLVGNLVRALLLLCKKETQKQEQNNTH